METKHTPGPWHYDGYIVTADAGNPNQAVARVQQFLPEYREESAANAALICAAPDMIDALRKMLATASCREATYNNNIQLAEAVDVARAAIVKAEGR